MGGVMYIKCFLWTSHNIQQMANSSKHGPEGIILLLCNKLFYFGNNYQTFNERMLSEL